jgi:hypothetical protein
MCEAGDLLQLVAIMCAAVLPDSWSFLANTLRAQCPAHNKNASANAHRSKPQSAPPTPRFHSGQLARVNLSNRQKPP